MPAQAGIYVLANGADLPTEIGDGDVIMLLDTNELQMARGGVIVPCENLQIGPPTRRIFETNNASETGATGLTMWPDNYTITTTGGAGAFLHWTGVISTNIPGGAPFQDDVAPGAVNLQGEVIFIDPGGLFASGLLFNHANTYTLRADIGPIYTILDQTVKRGDGALYTSTQHNAFRIQPKLGPNINGGSVTQTDAEFIYLVATADATVGSATWSNLKYIAAKNPGVTAGGVFTQLVVMDIESLTVPVTAIGIRSAMASGQTFISHTGTAPSAFAGDIRMNDSVDLLFGTSNGVALRRTGVDILTIGDQALGTTTVIDCSDPNAVTIGSTGTSNLQFAPSHLAFGETTPAATENWFAVFSPGARSTTLTGNAEHVLFTAGGDFTIDHAMTTVATWALNEPQLVIGTGSVTTAATLVINNAPTEGTNNYALLVGSGLTRVQDLEIAGRLGINVTSPGQALHVFTNADTYTCRFENDVATGVAGAQLLDDSGTARSAFGHANGTFAVAALRDTVFFGTTGAQSTILITNNVPRLTIDSAGVVTIAGELHLDGDLNHDGTNIGLHGAAPVAQATISGSRAGNAALASLLAALATRGDFVDSTIA